MSATTYNVLHTDRPRHDRVAGNVPSNLRGQRPGPINRSLSGLSRSTGHPAKLGGYDRNVLPSIHFELKGASVDMNNNVPAFCLRGIHGAELDLA
ncbi:hypothetical protein MRX96_053524 [Rhipicephalus microplus]